MKAISYLLAVLGAIPLLCLEVRGQDSRKLNGSTQDVRDERSVAEWISLAKSTKPALRLEAAKGLGRFGREAEKVVPALTKLLDDDFWATRMEAALSLGRIGPNAKAAVPRLATSLTDCDFSVREAAYSALGRMGEEARPAVPELVHQLDSTDWRARGNGGRGPG